MNQASVLPSDLTGVARTLAITLRARADEQARDDGLFRDPLAAAWYARLPRSADQDAWYAPVFQLSSAIRTWCYDDIARHFCAAKEAPLIVELGAGLSTRFARLADLPAHWVELDLPEVIAVRRVLDSETERHSFLGASLSDDDWLDQLPPALPAQTLFIAEGVLFFLAPEEVRRLAMRLRARFPGARFAFDVIGDQFSPASRTHFAAMDAPMRWLVADLADVAAFGLHIQRHLSTLMYAADRWRALGITVEQPQLRSGGAIVEAELRPLEEYAPRQVSPCRTG